MAIIHVFRVKYYNTIPKTRWKFNANSKTFLLPTSASWALNWTYSWSWSCYSMNKVASLLVFSACENADCTGIIFIQVSKIVPPGKFVLCSWPGNRLNYREGICFRILWPKSRYRCPFPFSILHPRKLARTLQEIWEQ